MKKMKTETESASHFLSLSLFLSQVFHNRNDN